MPKVSGERFRCVTKNMAEIPRDDRDLTARICGDPLPERSALNQYHQRQTAGKDVGSGHISLPKSASDPFVRTPGKASRAERLIITGAPVPEHVNPSPAKPSTHYEPVMASAQKFVQVYRNLACHLRPDERSAIYRYVCQQMEKKPRD
jgi:hypothetical protein